MTGVTGKFQITLPKRLVDTYGIRVGDEVELVAAGDSIVIVPARSCRQELSTEEQLRLFDATSQWLESREWPVTYASDEPRGWTREELYERGRPRGHQCLGVSLR